MIGLGLFLIIFVKPIVTQKAFLLSVMIILFVILGSLMGQKASRFFWNRLYGC
ncbi:PF07220 domain protein [Leptospira interrogans serovar Pyrogenes str. L0374]|uniref:PF07220 domain protein n=1 Tax=Leptospira interrogans serovar Pyrogenes str. L0374 TaxID=1049928 RepID=M6KEM6_LEPIR|nr:PF07220 domain protein [Leptospira interrogans serovar Pyrogenes str. L0374]